MGDKSNVWLIYFASGEKQIEVSENKITAQEVVEKTKAKYPTLYFQVQKVETGTFLIKEIDNANINPIGIDCKLHTALTIPV